MENIYTIADKDLKSTKLSPSTIEDLTTKLTLYQYLKNGIDRFLTNLDRPEAMKVWCVISMEQYRDRRAGKIIVDEDKRVMEQISYAFRLFQEKGKIQDGDPMVLAHLYGYSLRAIHLDYTLHKTFDEQSDYSRNKMYELMELFVEKWEQ